jgi:hypothetical protein
LSLASKKPIGRNGDFNSMDVALEDEPHYYEFKWLHSTYRFPSQTWFSRRFLASSILWVVGIALAFVWKNIIGVPILICGMIAEFYVFEKGYRLGKRP